MTALVLFHESYSRPAPLPSGVGTSRTSQTLKGYGAGIVTTRVSGTISTYIATTKNDTPENFSITTNPANNRATAVFRTQDAVGSQSAMLVNFGNPSGNSSARQAFIDDNIFGIRASTSLASTINGAASIARIALVTSAFTSLSSALTSGVSFCACAYTKWGFISGEVRTDDFSERQRLHLMPWVAGRLSGSSVTSPLTGSATYSGHVAANISNASGQQYVAFGNYAQSWNFSSRTGTATISNLDGATYSGSISNVSGSGGAEFQGPISGAGRSGSLQGAFMRGASSNVGEVGAQFHVTGGSYSAAGVALG
ncbi:MAG: hypothetical protein VCE74_15185 [Alphaproteobacteria bacterium]